MKVNVNGISIITCSVKPEICEKMLESVKNTIGTNHETIIFDNREKNLGICQVYNTCASKANFPYLCFIHEDIIIPTPNWGTSMVSFVEKTPNCGIIGFAGGTVAKRNFLGWGLDSKGRYRYYDPCVIEKSKVQIRNGLSYKYNNPENEDFAKVVTLDGLFLFVKKVIWEEYSFDENEIKGFQFYDADFSFGIAQKYQNYVCLIADIYHFSGGKIDKAYYENARIFQNKWRSALPHIIGAQRINLIDEMNDAKRLFVQSIRYGFTLIETIEHFLRINGVFFFLVFCVLIPIWGGKKILRKISKYVF